jgi:hypothetical protein
MATTGGAKRRSWQMMIDGARRFRRKTVLSVVTAVSKCLHVRVFFTARPVETCFCLHFVRFDRTRISFFRSVSTQETGVHFLLLNILEHTVYIQV